MKFLAMAIPNWFIPDSLIVSFSEMINNAMGFNGVIPIADLFLCLSVILWFHIIKFTFNIISGFISILRGGGNMSA